MNQRIIKVFLASPSKLDEERASVSDAISRINSTIGTKLNYQLQLISWESSIYSDIGKDGQDVINKQVDDNYNVFYWVVWGQDW